MTQAEVNAPLFMFGFERSGTTLLSMLVGAHPQIAVPLTVTGLFYDYESKLGDYRWLAEQHDRERLVDDLMAEERIRLWDVQLVRKDVLDKLPPASYPAVVERLHALYAAAKDKPRWGNLDIATLDEMDAVNRWFPNARFVHIVRDGRDVALSHETMPYGAANALECAENWNHRLRVNLKMGAILGRERYHVVRYEDLILETEQTLQHICEFAGLDYSEEMLAYGDMVDEKIPQEKRWLWPDLAKGPVKHKAYGWRKRMGTAKRAVFESVAGELLGELGYQRYAQPPKSLARYGYEFWCFLGHGGRLRRLARKLGLRRASKLERAADSAEKGKRNRYVNVQTNAFAQLVKDGTYDESFSHPEPARRFFRSSLVQSRAQIGVAEPVRVLDCGCGTGYWLSQLIDINADDGRSYEYFGFDLTAEMVDVAHHKLAGIVPANNIKTGDILRRESYRFGDSDREFGLIFAYDVIQQLPPRLQQEACAMMVSRLAQGGAAVIIDHDSQSPYGRSMAWKKLLTRTTGYEFVPRYYCNARYPALTRLARQFEADGYSTQTCVAQQGHKRALIIRRAAATAG